MTLDYEALAERFNARVVSIEFTVPRRPLNKGGGATNNYAESLS